MTINSMRCILILLSCVIFSCEDNHKPIESLGAYDIPVQPDSVAMIYTYRSSHGDILKDTYGFYHHNGSVRVMQTLFMNDQIRSERFYKRTGNKREFIEEYWYDDETSEKIMGDIKTFKDYNDGKPYRAFESHTSFTNNDGFRKSFREKFTYLKDTTILWNGKVYPALKFKGEFKDKKVIKYLPFYGDEFEYSGDYYYAKEIGYVKSILTAGSERIEWELTSIQHVPQRNAVALAMLRRRNFESSN